MAKSNKEQEKVKLTPSQREALIGELLDDYYNIVRVNPSSSPADILVAISLGRRSALTSIDVEDLKYVSKGIEKALLRSSVNVKWDLPTHYQVLADRIFKEFLLDRKKDPEKKVKDAKALNLAFIKVLKLQRSGRAIGQLMSKDRNWAKVAEKLTSQLTKRGYDV